MFVKRMAVMAMVMGLAAMGTLEAKAEGKSLSIDAAYASRYIWRGIPINEEAVVQPSITLSEGDFSLNAWGSMDTTDWGVDDGGYGDETGNLTEVDYTAGWGGSLGPVGLSGGFISYTFPSTPFASTTELFLGAGLDVPLSPSVTYYLDVDGPYTGPVGYLSFDLGQSIPLWEEGDMALSLDLSAHGAHTSENYIQSYYGLKDGDKWHDWSAGAALPFSLPAGFSITPSYAYTSIIDEDLRDIVEDGWDRDPETGVFMISLGWAGSF